MRFLMTLVCFLILAVSCAHQQNGDISADRQRIDASRRETEAAENAGSVERMRRQIADDVVMMAPNMPAVAGADNAMAAMQMFFDAFQVQIQYDSQEIVVSGDWAFDRGTYKHKLTPRQGGPAMEETGKYLWLFRRDPDGSWKQARVIWNSDAR